MAHEAKVTIVNKSASMATVTYTNWNESTSRSIVIPAGSTFVTYNWWELVDGDATAMTENILNLPLQDNNPLTKCLISDFGYDKTKVSITLAYDYLA